MLTSFVGREAEVAAVADLLGRSRIVSLTGPGGTGKTRLSVGVAEAVADRFPDGAVFVELAPIRDPALVAPAIGAALGVAEAPDQPIAEVLRRYLDEKTMLLVLDNLEQLLPAAASIVADLVHGAAGLRVLISTREPLRVSGEQEYPVPPLGASEAEALFLDRARLARPDFVATGDEAAPSPGSPASSTACRSRSSWRRRVSGSSRRPASSSGSATRSTSSPAAGATSRNASGRSAARSAGATTSCPRPSRRCSDDSRSSSATGRRSRPTGSPTPTGPLAWRPSTA